MKQSDFINKISDRIHQLGLATPAILLLEAHKPLAFVGSQLLLIAQPTLDIFLPQSLTTCSAQLLANPAQLEQLILKLESSSLDSPNSPAPMQEVG